MAYIVGDECHWELTWRVGVGTGAAWARARAVAAKERVARMVLKVL
jgi:hypothetical protein